VSIVPRKRIISSRCPEGSSTGSPGAEAGAAPGAPAPGFGSSLSTKLHGSAKNNHSHIVRFSVGGEHIAIKPIRVKIASKAALPPDDDVLPPARKPISTFSGKSKLNLKRMFARLDKRVTKRAQMVTLTYALNMQDARQAKKHLHAFAQALHRSYEGAGYIWKMECQKRGAIHFHLLIFGVRFLPWEWVAEVWTRIVFPGSGMTEQEQSYQLQAGTECRAAKSLWEAKSYLEKYLGKTDQTGDLDNPGRWWGTHALEAYHAPVVEVPLTSTQVVTIARTLDKLHRAAITSAWSKRAMMSTVCYNHSDWRKFRFL
jgi:hypothetical protein